MAFSGEITSMIMRYMYGGKGVHRGTLVGDDILVRHGEQIALIHSQLHVKLTDGRKQNQCTRAALVHIYPAAAGAPEPRPTYGLPSYRTFLPVHTTWP